MLTIKKALTPDSSRSSVNDELATDSEEYREWTFHKERAEMVTKWPLVAYLIAALMCMGLSTVCHLFWVRNDRICTMLTYLDYWGICLLGLGTAYPYIAFKYACGSFILWRYVFTSVITLLMGVCCWATV